MRRLLLCLLFLTAPLAARAEEMIALTSNGRLLIFDSATPGTIMSSVTLSGLVGGEAMVTIDMRPHTGQIFGLGATPGNTSNRFYVINRTTGVATPIAPLPAGAVTGNRVEIDFNPNVDRIRLNAENRQNARFNPNDGSKVAEDTLLTLNGNPARITATAYSNNVPGGTPQQFGIDTSSLTTPVLGRIDPPNSNFNGGAYTSVGNLGVSLSSDFMGLDVSGETGTLYAALDVGGSNLYSINPTTGAATLLGAIGGLTGGERVIGLTTAAVPEPGTMILAGFGGVGALAAGWRHRRRRKQKAKKK